MRLWVLLLGVAWGGSLHEKPAIVPEHCTPASEARDGEFTVLTSLPFIARDLTGAHPHFVETLLALGENTRMKGVVEVRVILDRYQQAGSSKEYHVHGLDQNATESLRSQVRQAQEMRRERLDAAASETELKKLTAHVFGNQPTYGQMFRYASYALYGKLVILTNADVVFRNLDVFDAGALEKSRTVLLLAVRKPTGAFAESCGDDGMLRVIDRCDKLAWSFDSYIFHAPVVATARWDLLEEISPNPVYMNDNAAEHRTAAFLLASGYNLYQACLYNVSEHWHCLSKMHHTKGNKNVEPVDGDPRVTRRGFAQIKPAKDFPGIRCDTPSSELHNNLLPVNWKVLVN